MAQKKFQISVTVDTEALDDSAGFSSVLAYVIKQQIKALPGVLNAETAEVLISSEPEK